MTPQQARDDEDEARMQLEVERRLIRIETRLTRLMRHFGLRADGTPALNNQPTQYYRDDQ